MKLTLKQRKLVIEIANAIFGFKSLYEEIKNIELLEDYELENFVNKVEDEFCGEIAKGLTEEVAFDYALSRLIQQFLDQCSVNKNEKLKFLVLRKIAAGEIDKVLQDQLSSDVLSPNQLAVVSKLVDFEIVDQFKTGDMAARRKYCHPNVVSCLGTRRLGYLPLLQAVLKQLEGLKAKETQDEKKAKFSKNIKEILENIEQEKRRLNFSRAAINSISHYLGVIAKDSDLSIDEVLMEAVDQNSFLVLTIKEFIANGEEKNLVDMLLTLLPRFEVVDMKKVTDVVNVLTEIISEELRREEKRSELALIVAHALLLDFSLSEFSEAELKKVKNQKTLMNRLIELNRVFSSCKLFIPSQAFPILTRLMQLLDNKHFKIISDNAKEAVVKAVGFAENQQADYNMLLLTFHFVLNRMWKKFLQAQLPQPTLIKALEKIIISLQFSKEFYFKVGDLINHYGMKLYELHAKLSAEVHGYFEERDASAIPMQVYKYYATAYSVLQTDSSGVLGVSYRKVAELRHKESFLLENRLETPALVLLQIKKLPSIRHRELLNLHVRYEKAFEQYINDVENYNSISCIQAAMWTEYVELITAVQKVRQSLVKQTDKQKVLYFNQEGLTKEVTQRYATAMQEDVAQTLKAAVSSSNSGSNSQLAKDIHRTWTHGYFIPYQGEEAFLPSNVDVQGIKLNPGEPFRPTFGELSSTPHVCDWAVLRENMTKELVAKSVNAEMVKAIIETYATQSIYAGVLDLTSRILTFEGYILSFWKVALQSLRVYVNKDQVIFMVRMHRIQMHPRTLQKKDNQVAVTSKLIIDASDNTPRFEFADCEVATITGATSGSFKLVSHMFELSNSDRTIEEFDPFYVYNEYAAVFFGGGAANGLGIMNVCVEDEKFDDEQKLIKRSLELFYEDEVGFQATVQQFLAVVHAKLSESILDVVTRKRYEALGQMSVGSLLFYAQLILSKLNKDKVASAAERVKMIGEVYEICHTANVFFDMCQLYVVNDNEQLLIAVQQLALQTTEELVERAKQLTDKLTTKNYDQNDPRVVGERFNACVELIKIKQLQLQQARNEIQFTDTDSLRKQFFRYQDLFKFLQFNFDRLLHPSHAYINGVEDIINEIYEECVLLQKELFKFGCSVLDMGKLDLEKAIGDANYAAKSALMEYAITVNSRMNYDPRKLLEKVEQQLFQLKLSDSLTDDRVDELKESYIYEKLSTSVLAIGVRKHYEALGQFVVRSSLTSVITLLGKINALDGQAEKFKSFRLAFIVYTNAKKLFNIYRFAVAADVLGLLSKVKQQLFQFTGMLNNLANALEMQLMQRFSYCDLIAFITVVQCQFQQVFEDKKILESERQKVLADLYQRQSKLLDDLNRLFGQTHLAVDAEVVNLYAVYREQGDKIREYKITLPEAEVCREIVLATEADQTLHKFAVLINSRALQSLSNKSRSSALSALIIAMANSAEDNLSLLITLVLNSSAAIPVAISLIEAGALSEQALTPTMAQARNKFNQAMLKNSDLVKSVFSNQTVKEYFAKSSLIAMLACTAEYAHPILILLALTDGKNSLDVVRLIELENLPEKLLSPNVIKARAAFRKALLNNTQLLMSIINTEVVIEQLIANLNIVGMTGATENVDESKFTEASKLLSDLWGNIKKGNALTKILTAKGLVFWLLKFVNGDIDLIVTFLRSMQVNSAGIMSWFSSRHPDYRQELIDDPDKLARLFYDYLVQDNQVNQQHFAHLMQLFEDNLLAEALLKSNWAIKLDLSAMSKSKNEVNKALFSILDVAKKHCIVNSVSVTAAATASVNTSAAVVNATSSENDEPMPIMPIMSGSPIGLKLGEIYADTVKEPPQKPQPQLNEPVLESGSQSTLQPPSF